jgi:hypothetical protein
VCAGHHPVPGVGPPAFGQIDQARPVGPGCDGGGLDAGAAGGGFVDVGQGHLVAEQIGQELQGGP